MTEVAVPVRPDEFQAVARVVVVWPLALPGDDITAVDGWKVAILNADTGDAITTITRLMVCSDAEGVVWARARMLANVDGDPIISGPGPATGVCVGADGNLAEGDFDLWVTEMRVRAWPDEVGNG